MTTAIIADDEPLLRDELRDALAELWPELDIVAECADGVAALNEIEQKAPDIAFLDIRMPRMNGLEAAEQISNDTLVVFVTAFDDHAIQAFDHGAVDYVMKPIRLARIAKTIQRLRQRLSDRGVHSDATKRVAKLLNAGGGTAPRFLKFIQASVGKQVRFVMVEEIVYIQSDSKYTRIVTLNSEAFIRKPLSELEAELDPDMFWRVHRGTLVNVRSIELVVRDEVDKMSVKLKGLPDKLEVSRAHQSQFRGL